MDSRNKQIQRLSQQLLNLSLEQNPSNQSPSLTCDYAGGKLTIYLGYPEVEVAFENPVVAFSGKIFVPNRSITALELLNFVFDHVDEAMIKYAVLELQNESPRIH